MIKEINFLEFSNKKTNNIYIYIIFEKYKYNNVELFFLGELLNINNIKNRSLYKKKLKWLYNSNILIEYDPQDEYDAFKISINYINRKTKIVLYKEIRKLLKINLKELNIEEKYFNVTRDNIIYNIKSTYDDRISYVIEKAWENLFKIDENYITNTQAIKIMEKINQKKLQKIWCNILNNLSCEIFFCGQEKPKNKIINLNNINVKSKKQIYSRSKFSIIENKNNNQSKLVLVYNIKNFDKSNYLAYNMFNLVFGGDTHSYLFKEIREKESLCYFIKSNIYFEQESMLVIVAIDKKNIKFTKEKISKQFLELEKGNFKDKFENTKIILIENFKKIKENPETYVKFNINEILKKRNDKIEDKIKQIENITIDEIVEISKNIEYYGNYELN